MSVLLRNTLAPAAAMGLEWPTPETVVEVTEAEAAELLAIKDAGFEVAVQQPEPRPRVPAEPGRRPTGARGTQRTPISE